MFNDPDEFYTPFKHQVDRTSHEFNWTYLEEWLNNKSHAGDFSGFGMPTVYVAAYNASDKVKAMADFVCDGTSDEVEINEALVLLDDWDPVSERGGVLQLSAGDFYCTDYINIPGSATSIWLRGMGFNATQLHTDGDAPIPRWAFIQNYSYYPQVTDLYAGVYHNNYYSTLEVDPPGGDWGMVRNCDLYWGAPEGQDMTSILKTEQAVRIYDCDFHGGNDTQGAAAIQIGTGIRGGIISGCHITPTGNLDHAINVYGNATGWKIIGNYISTGTADSAISLNFWNIHGFTIIGNTINDEIDIGANTDSTIIGGNFDDSINGPTVTVTDNGTNTVYLDNNAIVPSDASPLTTKGDLWGFDTEDDRIPVGTDDHVLTVDSAQALGVKWAAIPNPSPLTTKGDLHVYTTDDARLAAGTDDHVLTADSSEASGVKWAAAPGASSPLTTKGDLFTYDTDDQRLGIGTDDHVLTADSSEATGMKWAAATTGGLDLTTKGQIHTHGASADAALAVGSDDQVLTADSSEATGLKWATPAAGSGGLTLLDTTTLTSDATHIEVSGLSGAYTDLVIQATLRSDVSATNDSVQLNVGNSTIDTGTNYHYASERMGTTEDATTASSATKWQSANVLIGDTAGAGYESMHRYEIFDYASTSRERWMSVNAFREDGSNRLFERGNCRWANSANAIDVVRLTPTTGSNFKSGSEVRIWGRS